MLALNGFVFALSVAVWPGFRLASEAPKMALLLVFLPLLLCKYRDWSWWGAALFGMGVASLLWAPIGVAALGGLLWATLLALVLSLKISLDDIWYGLLAGLAVNTAIAGLQYDGMLENILANATQPAGTFGNKNFLGEFAAIVGVLALVRKSFLGSALAIIAVGMSQSAGAALGFAAGAIALAWPRVWPLILGALGAAVLWSGAFATSVAVRLSLWSEALAGASLWGHGIGHFYSMFPYYSSDTLVLRHEHAHSLPIELLFELGLFGFAWSLGIFLTAYWKGHKLRPAILCLGAISLVGFPLWNPATLLVGGLVLGSALRGGTLSRRAAAVGERPVFCWTPKWGSRGTAQSGKPVAAELGASQG